jgi:hypothetical protein
MLYIGITGVDIYRRYVVRLTNGRGHRSPDVISSKPEEIKMQFCFDHYSHVDIGALEMPLSFK